MCEDDVSGKERSKKKKHFFSHETVQSEQKKYFLIKK